jgi:2-hydroxymuconate-semialdehyde hydrolase
VLAGLPVREGRLDVAGIETVVLEGGDGSPLLLLHGGIECGGAYWARVVSPLAKAHRLVVPDLPGLGESEPVARPDEAFGEWFAELLRLTCEERPVVVAHSLLGGFAARFAAQRPDLLRRLVIYGAPAVGAYRIPAGLAVAAIRFDLRPTQRNVERFERWVFPDPAQTKRQNPAWFEAFDAYAVACGRVPHVKRTMRRLIKTGKTRIPDDELRRIQVPTALLWGRHDRMVPLRLAEEASARLDWPLHVIEGAGHAPHVERPDAFLEALRGALATSPPSKQRRSP